MRLAILFLALLGNAALALGENHISADRRIDWNTAGVKGGIVSRLTQCGATLASSSTVAQINSAIAACGAGQFVKLAAGTFTLNGELTFNGKSNVTLRGSGPDQTFLVFTAGGSCNGLGGYVCIKSSSLNDLDSPGNTANWTAGYAKGTSVITLSSTANMQPGVVLILDRVNDSTTDNGAVWMNRTANVACYDCASPSRSSGGLRTQSQATRVVAVNGTQVTIDPPVIWPNFASGQNPGAWWASGPAITGVGIEDLAINTEGGAQGGGSIFLANARDSWIKNVRLEHCKEKCIWMYQTVGVEVRDSYFYDKAGADNTQEGSESYGTNAYLSSMWRVENNIFHHITSAMQCEAGVGGVEAYNYTFDGFYNETNPDWFQGSSYTHGACAYTLREGNIGQGFIQDVVHAPNYFHTALRNRYYGWQLDNFGNGQTLQTVAVHIYAPNRYNNILGNVLGTSSYHTKYESHPSSAADCDTSIFALGFGGNCGGGSMANKADVRISALRWRNYDVVTNGTRLLASEVPAQDPNFPNAVPSATALPASLYLSGKPAWFSSTVPFPAIGPDVSGGNIANVAGFANKIPAVMCYEATSKVNGVLNFNASSCYGSSAPTAPSPSLPVPVLKLIN